MSFRIALASLVVLSAATCTAQSPWKRHAIDSSDDLRGADGVRLADFNGDGLSDIVSGWEESGIVRLYLNPGHQKAKQPWPVVTVGKSRSPEDAVPFDVDGDGNLDVVSCHEGNTRKVLVHRFVGEQTGDKDLLDPQNWETTGFPMLGHLQWMFAAPVRLQGGGEGLVIGAKNNGATVTLLLPPESDRADLHKWSAIQLRDAGWIMSIRCVDMDGDGDEDVLLSDRKGSLRGVYWLEQPEDPTGRWLEHAVGAKEYEVMFLDVVKEESSDRVSELLVSTRNSAWFRYTRRRDGWNETRFEHPDGVPHGKAIARLSASALVMTANTARSDARQPGLWLSNGPGDWSPIGHPEGGKFDRIELIDLDGDGDLDILTCEERRNHGVIWFENPR